MRLRAHATSGSVPHRRLRLSAVSFLLSALVASGTAAAQDESVNTTAAGLGYGSTEGSSTENISSTQSYLEGLGADFTRERGLIPAAGVLGTYLIDGTFLPSLSSAVAGICAAIVGIALTLATRPATARRFMDDWNRVYTTLTHLLVIGAFVALAVTFGALGGTLAALTVGVAFTLYARGRFLGWLKELGPSTP